MSYRCTKNCGSEGRRDRDRRMAESSESVKLEVLQNTAVQNSDKSASVDVETSKTAVKTSEESLSAEVEAIEDVVVKNVASVDTTDKKTKQENSFAAKKTVAQGMMDVALITANANQLRYLFEYQRGSPTFYFVVVLIAISLLLQVTQCRGCVARRNACSCATVAIRSIIR